MSYENEKAKAVLLLENGHLFKGNSFGKKGTVVGRLTYNAGMTGYQELITDPSNLGQLLVMGVPHIGNYGVNEKDLESKDIQIKGLIAKQIASRFSRMTSKVSMKEYLEEQEVVAIENIDTRALISHLTVEGGLKAVISSEDKTIEELQQILNNYSEEDYINDTTYQPEAPYYYGIENASVKVAVINYGLKKGILDSLAKRDAYLKVFNDASTIDDLQEFGAQAIVLSNGPGNPKLMEERVAFINELKTLGLPIFAIGLGFQLLAISYGLPTYQLDLASKGPNHPVKNLLTNRCEITAQNHNYGVCSQSLEQHASLQITHQNLNDQTYVGFRHKELPISGVVFHPESKPGTHDSQYLFDDFFQTILS